MAQEFIVLKIKYKGTEIIFRRWFDGGKEEILVDNNFARLMGFPSKKELIKDMIKDTEIDYKDGDFLWVCFNDATQNVTDNLTLTIEKAELV